MKHSSTTVAHTVLRRRDNASSGATLALINKIHDAVGEESKGESEVDGARWRCSKTKMRRED